MPPNRMFLISGNNTGTGILQNIMDSDGTGLICEAEAELRSAIDSLPEKLRVPLLLRYMERYSETEIAQTLGVPVTTVKNRLFRARRAVRAKFDEEVTFE